MDWKMIPKIDGHVHLLPPEKLEEFRREDDGELTKGDPGLYRELMDRYCVKKAVLVPNNNPHTYLNGADKTNAWLGSMTQNDPDRFVCFADVQYDGCFNLTSPESLELGVNEYGLKGLKLHPTNLGINIDDLRMVPVVRKAADLHVPVMIHSYPYFHPTNDCCEPSRIHHISRAFPDAVFIISHMGGYRWIEAVSGTEYVDISAFLPELVKLYGIEQANRVLRAIGVDRLIFATDYPFSVSLKPETIYETYCDILNQMDFTEAEAEKIAWRNMAGILKLNSI